MENSILGPERLSRSATEALGGAVSGCLVKTVWRTSSSAGSGWYQGAGGVKLEVLLAVGLQSGLEAAVCWGRKRPPAARRVLFASGPSDKYNLPPSAGADAKLSCGAAGQRSSKWRIFEEATRVAFIATSHGVEKAEGVGWRLVERRAEQSTALINHVHPEYRIRRR